MIQQLQKKILDQQERLAVAVKVDRAKDAAINKLREAWLRLTGNLDKAEERHRQALEKMVREVENFRMVADDAQKVLLTTSSLTCWLRCLNNQRDLKGSKNSFWIPSGING